MILFDHASPESFFGNINPQRTPYISKYILGVEKDNTYSKATICRNMVTGFPSTSANSHLTLITGGYQGKSGLLYQFWWDLTGDIPHYEDVNRIKISMVKKFNMEYISKDVKLLFDYCPDSASFHAIHRGAKYKTFRMRSIIFNFLPILFKLKKKSDPNSPPMLADPIVWKTLLKKNLKKFLKRAKNKGELPEVSFFLFLLSDETAHKYGFNSPEYRESLDVLDFFIKMLVEGLDVGKKKKHIPGLKELGIIDTVNWVITTDHAGRESHRDRRKPINEIIKYDLGLACLEGKKNNFDDYLKKIDYRYEELNAFVVISGGLYFGWFSGPDGVNLSHFNQFYGEKYFRAILPRGIQKSHSDWENRVDENGTVDLISFLLKKQYVHHILIPEKKGESYHMKIFSSSGVGLVERSVKNETGLDKTYFSYQILEGEDPLDYGGILEYGKLFEDRIWLRETHDKRLPDIFARLFGLFDCHTAPNFVTTSSFDYQFWSIYDVVKKREKEFFNVQVHDGLYAEESVVPAVFSGPLFKDGKIIPFGKNPDVVPTILKALKIPYNDNDLDGIALNDAII